MLKEITASGKDIMEAKENARLALGADDFADVKYEILHAGSKGIFGLFGTKPALVKASMEIPDAAPRRERTKERGTERRTEQSRQSNNAHALQSAKPVRTETAAAADDTAAAKEQAPAAEKKSQGRKRRNRGNQNRRPQTEKASAVFESELAFTKLDVKPGEDKAFDFVCTLVRDLGLDAEVELMSCSDGTRRVNINGEAASILIGHHGDTLDAVQYLANLACAQKNENGERDKSRVTVNIEGYRAKREETLRTLARSMAAKALRTHRSVALEPMSPYERRIIHSEIQGIDGVATNSVGTDNNRKVIIYIKGDKVSAEAAGIETDEHSAAQSKGCEKADNAPETSAKEAEPAENGEL